MLFQEVTSEGKGRWPLGSLAPWAYFLSLTQVKCHFKGQAGEEAERKLEQGLGRTWRRALGSLLGCVWGPPKILQVCGCSRHIHLASSRIRDFVIEGHEHCTGVAGRMQGAQDFGSPTDSRLID